MLEFMDYVQRAFYAASGWNIDSSYATLTATAHNLLDLSIPQGLRVHVSSLASPRFATSYTLGSRGVVDGSLSFLYSSLALQVASRSSDVPLNALSRGYRHLRELRPVPQAIETTDSGEKIVPPKDTLLYGRFYLPTSTLEASYLRRIAPHRLLRLNCVSNGEAPNGGTLLALLHNDYGTYSTEYLCSTDSALLGVRGLYNFGSKPLHHDDETVASQSRHAWDKQNGRLSAGAEAYFSPINKSGGVSTGLRFATLPGHNGFPYTMTLTLNPVMGNMSSAYAVQAGPNLSLCSRFDFNVYSYESDVVVGMELWRRQPPSKDVEWARRRVRDGWTRESLGEVTGVLKARMSDKGKMGVLWEGRVKELLVGLGASFDLKKRERMLGSVGLEVSYSS